MTDTLQIHQSPIHHIRNGTVETRWMAALNGIPMPVSEAMVKVRANPDNDGKMVFPLEIQNIIDADFLGRPWGSPITLGVPPAQTCDYCQSVSSGDRCPSCGAPRRAKKPSHHHNTWPECLHEPIYIES